MMDIIRGMLMPTLPPHNPAMTANCQNMSSHGVMEMKTMAPATVRNSKMTGLIILDRGATSNAAPTPTMPAADIRRPISVPLKLMLSM